MPESAVISYGMCQALDQVESANQVSDLGLSALWPWSYSVLVSEQTEIWFWSGLSVFELISGHSLSKFRSWSLLAM